MHNSQWITFPIQSCLVLHSFCANLPLSLIRWLIAYHNLRLLYFRLVYSCCFNIVFMMLFCVAIRRNSLSLLSFLFLSHDQDFSYEISLVCFLKCPYICLSSHFWFLVISVPLILMLSLLFQMALISLPPHLYMLFSGGSIDTLTLCWRLASPLLSVCLCHLWDVRPHTWSLVFFFGLCVEVFPSSTSKVAPSILRRKHPWC